ncbi:hypothetical protein PMAYCL1PPCAC_17061 [Pristionchus mayeri]|uniref:NR LBD domain-containing protein n=1 Tax=Pristionchus mayeri TaxID=1317129 RepID=A0AAN5CLX0_9BILA|nr:hypothetical protein PMAYCL1PPCAC_17061 [Pristionchus mayeri]
MTRIRKSSEINLRPLNNFVHPSDIAEDSFPNIPATHEISYQTRRILMTTLFDFASISFPDFTTLSRDEKWRLVSGSAVRVSILESSYRSSKIYPDDNRVFVSYTTTISPDSLDYYLSSTPLLVNIEEAKKELRKNLEQNAGRSKRAMRRIDPSDEEFLAMLALSFWNNSHESLCRMAAQNRAAVMRDLHVYYTTRGETGYATRIGELFCLLMDNEALGVNSELYFRRQTT